MRMSRLFGTTLREIPSEAETASHQLLLRAGFLRPLGAGLFSILPLARRSLVKIEAILREEMEAIGGQEIQMPVVHPAEIWKQSGRWFEIGAEMGRFQDRGGHDMVLAMTHEEAVADLVRREIRSYKQLPRLVYQIQTKFRDDPRPRAGLLRAREFTMKDSYSLDADWEGLERQYQAHLQAYFNVFHRCGLEVLAVRSDTGMMGGRLAHEFMFLNPVGEDSLLLCDSCGYTANRQVARFRKPPAAPETLQAITPVATPGCRSIEELTRFLQLPPSRTAKAVFYMAAIPKAGEAVWTFVFAVVRGDMEICETKLANAVRARELRPATEQEIQAVGAVAGYASPIGLRAGASGPPRLVIVDEAVAASPNLVAGANEPDTHMLNVNFPRDFTADLVTDLAAAGQGSPCPECGAPLRMERGVELGNTFQLGSHYSEALGCTFLDPDGQSRPVLMGSYGIGLGRLLACVAEAHHDDDGLAWPVTVAPFQVHLVLLRGREASACEARGEELYRELLAAGFEMLYDDRDETPGVKFKDADLIGLPLRITLSERSLQAGGVELKLRLRSEKNIVPFASLAGRLGSELAAQRAQIADRTGPVGYNGGSPS